MRVLIFLLLLPFNSFAQDALLEAMFKDWSIEEVEEDNYLEFPDSSEAEIYYENSYSDSWNLGTRDDIPETIIIYDKKDCYYH